MTPLEPPLSGVVVLDLGQIYQGPHAGFLAAKAGAAAGVTTEERFPLTPSRTRRRR